MLQFFTKLVTREVGNQSGLNNKTYYLTDSVGWMILGGTKLASHTLVERPDFIHNIHLQFHGGKNMWMCENEKWSKYTIYRREDYFGSLSTMMDKFQKLSGQNLQEVTWAQLGAGVAHHSAQGIRGGTLTDPTNPWELEEGAIYRYFDTKLNYEKQYRAVRVGLEPNKRMELKPITHPADYPETFSPSLIMDMLITKGGRAQFGLLETARQAQAASCVENDPNDLGHDSPSS